jgi:hypothetical protein
MWGWGSFSWPYSVVMFSLSGLVVVGVVFWVSKLFLVFCCLCRGVVYVHLGYCIQVEIPFVIVLLSARLGTGSVYSSFYPLNSLMLLFPLIELSLFLLEVVWNQGRSLTCG